MKWIAPTAPIASSRPPPRVFDASGREITHDDDRKAVPPGARVYVPLMLQDSTDNLALPHQPHSQPKDSEMTFSPHLTVLDGKTVTKDEALKSLQDQLTDAKSRADRLEGELSAMKAFHAPAAAQPVHDATATLRDAAVESRLRLRDHLLAQQSAKFDGSSPSGARAKELRDAWQQKPPQQQTQTWR